MTTTWLTEVRSLQRARLRMVAGWLAPAGVGAATLVAIVGLTIKATAGGLGTPLPPFLMHWAPELDGLAAVSVLVLGGGVLLAPRLLAVRSRINFAGGLYVLALALGLSANLARSGIAGWSEVFAAGPHGSIEGGFEYLPALPLLKHGIGYYLSHFAALFPYMTTHVKGNPPGPLVVLDLLGITTPGALAALCVGIGALGAPLTYDLARQLGDESRGRLAGIFAAFAPSMLLFGVTSLDYAFATLGLAVACLLIRPGAAALLAGSILAALVSFCSWLLLAIPAWAVAVTLLRSGWRPALPRACAVGVAVLAFNGVLALAFGYDPISALRETASAYRLGIAAARPYAFWLFGSPAAWALMLGVPLAWLSLRSLGAGDPAAIALWGLIAAAAILGFTKAETERVWLPFVPLACVAAAAFAPPRLLRPVLTALAAQTLLVEALFFTVW